jgi:nucleoside-diphosphate-sugar epimerase
MRKLIVGCGYLGLRVAERWLAAGHEVGAVTRSLARAEELRRLGIKPIEADVTRPETLAALPAAETVLYAVGYDRSGTQSRWEVYVGGLENFLLHAPAGIERLIYISSTGVYGQSDASWVDEQTECRPERDAGRAFWAAEQRLAAHTLGRRSIVLRMAGLYGPGRVPHRADLLAGRTLAVATDGYLNLIHVDDMADVVLAAEAKAPLPRLYVAADGHPAPRAAYYRYLAELLGVEQLELVSPAQGSAAGERARSNKRASNVRLRTELGVEFRYPSYVEGLRHSSGKGRES